MLRRLLLMIGFLWPAMTVAEVRYPAPHTSARAWFEAGEATVRTAQSRVPPQGRARNVILFVGDGMGLSTVTAARIFAGQQAGRSGEEHRLSFEHFPVVALSKTYTVNQQTPDSAPTMTAMVTGMKTRDRMISVDGDTQPGQCANLATHSPATLLERAERAGKATGIVTTTRLTHATPAANYAHSPDRDWESDADMGRVTGECAEVPDIARQFVEFDEGDGIDVALGGGWERFLPPSAAASSAALTGKRLDGRHLIDAWKVRYPEGIWVSDRATFDAVDPARTRRLLGMFAPSHMAFETDRDPAREPSLAEMTRKAIAILARDPDGFYLQVEGGRIDHAHHAGNAHRALQDTVALAEAVAVAVAMTRAEETLIVVTADHSHVFTLAGYPARGNAITGLVRDAQGRPAHDARGMPYTTLGYTNGPGYAGASAEQPEGPKHFPHLANAAPDRLGIEPPRRGRPDLSDVAVMDEDYLQECTVPFQSETHAGEDVPLYATGPGAWWFQGSIEQHVVFHVIRAAAALP